MNAFKSVNVLGKMLRRIVVAIGAVALTLAFFLVLPLIQEVAAPPDTDTLLTAVETANIPPPPPPPEEEPPKEPEEEPPPPELLEEAPPLDLSQLELALNPGFSEGWLGGDFAVTLNTVATAGSGDVDALFSMADLDQTPRAIYQPSPVLSTSLRSRTPGTVHVIFVVDDRGRVENPIVQHSSDPAFEAPALAAVKKWKFEPGKRNGQAVRFRMRVPITFPKGS